jgi:DNA-binding transcriptional LysR family regulator
MNSLDALAATAMEGAGIVRGPSWRHEADLAVGHLVRLLADDRRQYHCT